jgi:hypothetical protein
MASGNKHHAAASCECRRRRARAGPVHRVIIAHLAETPFGFLTSTLLPITPQTPKHLGFGVIMPFRVRQDTPFGLKTPASWPMAKCEMDFSTPNFSTSDIRPTDFLIFSGHIVRQFKSRPMPPELPGSVAGVYKWLLTPGRWPFWCFWGCFVAKNPLTSTQEVL